MSTLLSSLNTASTALEVFSRALGVEQTNVSNASTPGFAAIRANILPIGSSGPPLSGEDFIQLSSAGNLRTDASVRAASAQAAASQTAGEQLAPVNQLFDVTGATGILAALNQFSSAFASASVNPQDRTLRSNALAAAGNVANAFNSAASKLDSQKAQVDSQIQSTVSNINDLASQIRKYNVHARSGEQLDTGSDASLRSELDQLSSLVDISVNKNSDGTISVLAGGEQPLVLGDQSFSLSADLSAAASARITSSGGGNSPQEYSGQLGALLQVRNGTLAQLLGNPGTPGTLNTLAKGFAARVNSLVSAGTDASGSPGLPVFTYDASTDSNVARTLAVNPAITVSQLALASTGTTSESNGVGNELASLAQSTKAADQITGLSATGLFGAIAAQVGQQLADIRNQSQTDQTALTAAQADRQQSAGVSLDREAVAITSLQRAYQASARIVSVIDQLTSDEVNLIK